MRIDFREERKWKMVLAFNLSTSVLEWHAANSLEERLGKGICVRWKPSLTKVDDELPEDADEAEAEVEVEAEPADIDVEAPKTSLLGVDYGSDDDDDEDEADKDSQNIADPLEPTAVIEDALDGAAAQRAHNNSSGQTTIEPKTEDFDDPSVLIDKNNADMQVSPPDNSTAMLVDEEDDTKGLKSSSSDPILGSKPTPGSSNDDVEPATFPTKLSTKANAYAPLRERVAYSEETKLFLVSDDLATFKLELPSDNLRGSELHPDLNSIFPDLQPLALLDIPPIVSSSVPEGKRRSEKRSDRDDPAKRSEDTTYAKLFSIGEFMFSKPTLLGPLQPSKNWKNGRWATFEDSAGAEVDSGVRVSDEGLNGEHSFSVIEKYFLIPFRIV
jgi:chromatin modification-related protein VID21